MKFWTVLTTLSVLTLTACATTTELPDGRKLKHKEVCRSLASNKCAPSVGKAKTLKPSPMPMVIDDAVSTTILSMVGTMVSREGKSHDGAQGLACGGTAQSPFTAKDLLVMRIKEMDIAYDAFDRKRTLFSRERLKADIRQALKQSGVATRDIGTLTSDIDTATETLRKTELKTTASFHQYQLRDDVLRELETAKYSSQFKSCLIDLKTWDWRLVQAVTGFVVEEEILDTDRLSAIVEPIALKAAQSDETLSAAQLTQAMEQAVGYQLNATIPSFFQPVGVSFWESQRYPYIR